MCLDKISALGYGYANHIWIIGLVIIGLPVCRGRCMGIHPTPIHLSDTHPAGSEIQSKALNFSGHLFRIWDGLFRIWALSCGHYFHPGLVFEVVWTAKNPRSAERGNGHLLRDGTFL